MFANEKPLSRFEVWQLSQYAWFCSSWHSETAAICHGLSRQ